MPISPTNAAKAARLTGLSLGGPIHIADLAELVAKTARLARFMDNLDRPIPDEFLQNLPPFDRKL